MTMNNDNTAPFDHFRVSSAEGDGGRPYDNQLSKNQKELFDFHCRQLWNATYVKQNWPDFDLDATPAVTWRPSK